VYRLVSERGGSVVLLAGPAHLPTEYGAHFVASSLLPYPTELSPTWRVWPGEEPMFRLVPDLEAVNEPVLRLGGDGGAASESLAVGTTDRGVTDADAGGPPTAPPQPATRIDRTSVPLAAGPR